MQHTDLKQKVVVGAAWMVGMRAAVNFLGFVSIIILARLLTPDDFGVVALAGSAYAFFSLIGRRNCHSDDSHIYSFLFSFENRRRSKL